MNKKCLKCNVEFISNSNNQRYCGSRILKIGCAYLVYMEYKKIDKQREYHKIHNKKYREKNRDKLIKYHQENQERYNEHARKYYKKNIRKNKDRWQKYYLNNKDRIKKHRQEMNNYSKRLKERRNNDIKYRILCNLRNRIWRAVKKLNKSAKSKELIGCSPEELKQYIEKQFRDGMSWDNYGSGKNGNNMKEWHIDHIKPCKSFDFTKQEDQKECFNYKNLQPLWARDNIKKRDRKE